MPSLDDILRQAMMFEAAVGGLVGRHKPASSPIPAPDPSPRVTTDPAIIMKNPVWAWDHDPARPASLANVRSKVRGMNMSYAHAMPVAETIALDEVTIAYGNMDAVQLPLTKDFVIRKYKLDDGFITAGSSHLWPLDAEMDQSIMVVFGYEMTGANSPSPIGEARVEKLDDELMPAKGKTLPPAEVKVDANLRLWVAPLRIIVVFSLTCCKERPDFTPGPPVMGMNRIYPHVMIMASQPLDRMSALISVVRPAKGMHAGKLPPNPGTGERDEMLPDIGPVLFADTNANVAPPPLYMLPLWSHIFDYYSVAPAADGIKSATFVDPRKTAVRTAKGAIQKLLPTEYVDALVTKVPRQGEFDNLHMAPRMRAPETIVRARDWHLDAIAMAPFCWHDCLHMHTRWGKTYTDKQTLGFDDQKNPCAIVGAPLVPHDQTVRVHLLPPAGFAYEASIDPHPGRIQPGEWQIFFHHGMGYANEVWDKNLFAMAQAGVELFSMGEKKWTPHTAVNSVALFYWRLRWGGTASARERIRFVRADSLARLRLF